MKRRLAAIVVVVALCPTFAAAENRVEGIAAMIRAGQAAEARTRLHAAIDAYRAEKDEKGEAIALLILGFANIQLRDEASARTTLEQAATKLAATGDHYIGWMSLFFVATFDMRQGKWKEARDRHHAALAILREAEQEDPDKKLSLDAMTALGPMFDMDISHLAPLIEAQPRMFKPMLFRSAELMSRYAIGNVHLRLGELDDAERELLRAQDLSSVLMGALDSAVAGLLGDVRRLQWKFDEAHQLYQRALGAADRMPVFWFEEKPRELAIMEQLAEIEMLRGRVDEALGWNDKVLQYARTKGKPGDDVSVLQTRALLLVQRNRTGPAANVLNEALKIAEALGNAELQGSVLTDLGAVQMYRGDFATAVATLEKALDFTRGSKEPEDEMQTWLILSEVYLAMSAYDSAAVTIQRVQELAEKSRYFYPKLLAKVLTAALKAYTEGASAEFIGTLESMAQFGPRYDIVGLEQFAQILNQFPGIGTGAPATSSASAERTIPFPGVEEMKTILRARDMIKAGDFPGARAILEKALAGNATADARTGFLAMMGVSYWNEKKPQQAATWFTQAADSVTEPTIADDELLARYLGSERRWYFDAAVEVLAQTGRTAEAFDYAERARARAFLQLVGNHRLAPRRGGSERLVAEAEALRTQIAQWERAGSPNPSDLPTARKHYRALMMRVRTSNPEYASITRVEPLSIDQVRRELPKDTTLVSYFVSIYGVRAWVLDHESLEYVKLPATREAMDRAVCWAMRFRPANARGTMRPEPANCKGAGSEDEAYALLIAPLRDKIRHRRLIVIPHGALHYIPFAALRDATSGRRMVEDFTLTLTPSASALRFLRDKETPITGGALVLGNPDSRLGKLPGAQREALAVARDLHTRAMLGAEAAESLMYGLGGEVDLLHVSAHGTYDPVNPIFSRIVLAAGGGHDGNLDVHEILSNVDLTGVNLVVLSACQTGAGERSGGDDMVGLTRAILYAGSPAVISTLWDIDDHAAAVLMEELYCRLLEGTTTADALREAQLALLRSDAYRDPKYWAAFTLTGNPDGRWTDQRTR